MFYYSCMLDFLGNANNDEQVKLVSPSLMPKLGKAGSLQSRQAIVHSLVHTESWAIDLSWVIQTPSFPDFFFFLLCYVFPSIFHFQGEKKI